MRALQRIVLSVVLAALALPVEAQFRQYRAPGDAATERAAPEERIEKALEEARWRLGPVRLSPWIGLRQVAYVDNVYSGSAEGEDVSDVTASVGAGLTASLPTGPNVLWVAEALPEYVWWRDLGERRQLVGRYGIGVVGGFNRVRFEATARQQEQDRIVSAEFPQQVLQHRREYELDGEVALTRRIGVFAAAGLADFEDRSHELEDPALPDFRALDREERRASAGVVYRPGDRWRIAAGVERTEVGFDRGARNLSNQGTSAVFGVRYDAARSFLDANAALYSLDADEGSEFPSYEEPGGDIRLGTRLGWRFGLELFAHKQPVLSLLPGYAYFDSRRVGAALDTELHRRLDLRLFAEVGEHVYERIGPAAPARSDDVTAYGAEFGIQVTRSLTASVGYRQEEYDSTAPGADRELGSVLTSLRFSPSFLQWD